ncbi:MAG: ethanolamine ammonia-lyase subunit EutC [Acidimicrobiia bacterium]
MTDELAPTTPPSSPPPSSPWLEARRRAAAITPARVFLGSAGLAHTTTDALALRADHAFARDAVDAPLDLTSAGMSALGLFEVATEAADHGTHLLRPDLGRRLSDAARTTIAQECPVGADVQVVVGDGLSAAAVHAQVPRMLPALEPLVHDQGWTWGRPFAVRHCRVGVMNDVGDLLHPEMVVLLVGERPGLGTAESLSAYLAYRPHAGCTDADRNLVANIHDRGTGDELAAERVVRFVEAIVAAGRSGATVREPDARGIAW